MSDGKPDTAAFLKVKPEWSDVCALIKNNLASDELNATFICEKLGISRSGLFRLFDGRGGIEAYIRAQRIKRVRLTLLKRGNRVKVKDLARHWHFSDSSHLCRVFRQTYGLTISEAKSVDEHKYNNEGNSQAEALMGRIKLKAGYGDEQLLTGRLK